MTPQELRSSILQLAIQGKLVEQRPEEGTAEELYQKIQKEKRQLIQEGKIKKEKPLPEIAEDEKPFEIPENWKWVRLGAIGLTHIGLTYSPKDISENGTIVLRSSNIQNSNVSKTEELLPYIDCYEQVWNRLEEFNKRFPVDMQKEPLWTAYWKKQTLPGVSSPGVTELVWFHRKEISLQSNLKMSVLMNLLKTL